MNQENLQPFPRVLSLPVFPKISHGTNVGEVPAENTPIPHDFFGGFFVGSENRLAELTIRFVNNGIPIFTSPLGNKSNALESGTREPSRADVEFLLSATAPPPLPIPDLSTLLFDRDSFNNIATRTGIPRIINYCRFEDVGFLSPLVFYGPSGSGKTRLVEGICQYRRLLDSNKTLYYLTATEFSHALNDAIRRDQTQLFRELFGQAQIIAIEDADVLATRNAAQIEILPMLDAAFKARKLVIFTFSQLPSTIGGFIPELTARLCSGLLTPINLPSRETRALAIERVTSQLKLQLDSRTKVLCLERLPQTIGGICGALVQMAREISTFHTPASYENILEFFERRNPAQEITVEKIVRAVAKYFSISIVEMRSPKRLKTLVHARKYVAFLARCLTGATLQQIGAQFSSRDHSTIIHSIHEIEELLSTSEQARHDLYEIAKILKVEEKMFSYLAEKSPSE